MVLPFSSNQSGFTFFFSPNISCTVSFAAFITGPTAELCFQMEVRWRSACHPDRLQIVHAGQDVSASLCWRMSGGIGLLLVVGGKYAAWGSTWSGNSWSSCSSHGSVDSWIWREINPYHRVCIFVLCYIADVDECAGDPCVHGTCSQGINLYSCSCSADYTGSNCDIRKLAGVSLGRWCECRTF